MANKSSNSGMDLNPCGTGCLYMLIIVAGIITLVVKLT